MVALAVRLVQGYLHPPEDACQDGRLPVHRRRGAASGDLGAHVDPRADRAPRGRDRRRSEHPRQRVLDHPPAGLGRGVRDCGDRGARQPGGQRHGAGRRASALAASPSASPRRGIFADLFAGAVDHLRQAVRRRRHDHLPGQGRPGDRDGRAHRAQVDPHPRADRRAQDDRQHPAAGAGSDQPRRPAHVPLPPADRRDFPDRPRAGGGYPAADAGRGRGAPGHRFVRAGFRGFGQSSIDFELFFEVDTDDGIAANHALQDIGARPARRSFNNAASPSPIRRRPASRPLPDGKMVMPYPVLLPEDAGA